MLSLDSHLRAFAERHQIAISFGAERTLLAARSPGTFSLAWGVPGLRRSSPSSPASAGTVLDTESPGLLLSSGGTAGPAAITVWPDSRFDDPSDGFIEYRSLFAQRVLSHP